MIFQPIEILVAFSTSLAFVWFMLFHPFGAFIRFVSLWINDRECAVLIGKKRLRLVAMLFSMSVKHILKRNNFFKI